MSLPFITMTVLSLNYAHVSRFSLTQSEIAYIYIVVPQQNWKMPLYEQHRRGKMKTFISELKLWP